MVSSEALFLIILSQSEGGQTYIDTGGVMFYTYIITSISIPTKTYIGFTSNIEERLKSHNLGKSSYTKKYRPWRLTFSAAFPDKLIAMDFEKYLKSGSGKAFASKHFKIK